MMVFDLGLGTKWKMGFPFGFAFGKQMTMVPSGSDRLLSVSFCLYHAANPAENITMTAKQRDSPSLWGKMDGKTGIRRGRELAMEKRAEVGRLEYENGIVAIPPYKCDTHTHTSKNILFF